MTWRITVRARVDWNDAYIFIIAASSAEVAIRKVLSAVKVRGLYDKKTAYHVTEAETINGIIIA